MTSCDGHAALPAEFRALLNGALDRIEPVLDRVQAQQRASAPEGGDGAGAPPPMGSAAACGTCPICAVVAVLRGERSELAARAVDHAVGVVAVLRAALDDGFGGAAGAGPGPSAAGAGSSGAAGSEASGAERPASGAGPAGPAGWGPEEAAASAAATPTAGAPADRPPRDAHRSARAVQRIRVRRVPGAPPGPGRANDRP